MERLKNGAQAIIGAGQETVAWVLIIVTCHPLPNPAVLQKLKAELATVIPDPDIITPEATSANLPILTGAIKDGLRLGYGASSRLARIPCHDWFIPAGTLVGMTSVLIYHDELIFPESKEFRHECWIEDPRLDRYLIAFSKGSRQCLGINLAYMEMYLWLAAVYRRFGLKEVRLESDEECAGVGKYRSF